MDSFNEGKDMSWKYPGVVTDKNAQLPDSGLHHAAAPVERRIRQSPDDVLPAPAYTSPWVMPGTYTARFTINGKVYEQPLILKMESRLRTPVEKLQQQHDLSRLLYEERQKLSSVAHELKALRGALDSQLAKAEKKDKAKLAT